MQSREEILKQYNVDPSNTSISNATLVEVYETRLKTLIPLVEILMAVAEKGLGKDNLTLKKLKRLLSSW